MRRCGCARRTSAARRVVSRLGRHTHRADPANKEKLITWARDYFNALHPHSAGGAYVNFMMEEGVDRIRATHGKNYARLAKIKKRYDPKNLFRVNQNIKPAT